MTSPCRAPTALRMPISRVRSVTLTSMMFMITMPPTTSEMQVTGTTMAAIMPSTWSMKPRMASGVSVSKLSGCAGARVKARAQQDAGFVQRALQVQSAARPRTAEEREAVAGAVHAVEGGDRDIDRIVQVAAEGRTETLLHADHGEFDAFDAHRLTERRGVAGEERGAHRIANHGHEGARTVFLLGEEAAIHHADIANVRHGRGRTQNRTVLADQVVALHIGDVLAVRAVEHAIAGEGFQEARVIRVDGLVAFDLFEVFAAAQAARGGNLRHQERLRPEGFGGTLLGVDAEAFNGRAHHDHAGHADDHAQQGQEAAQLLRADGIHRQPKCIEEIIPGADQPRVAVR